MKLSSTVLAVTAVITMLVVNGCYTQVARPDRGEGEPEYSETTEPVEEVQDQRTDDVRRVTYPYDYSDYYYGRPWYDPWDAWWYRYPPTGLYVGIGYHYYDPYWYDPFSGPGWCGSGWDPWWGGCGPSYWYSPWGRPGYVYYPVYDPYPHGGGGYTPEKRPFSRRSTNRERNGGTPSNGAIAKRGSLSRPAESIYVRGEDGSYRRERRRVAEPVATTGGSGTDDHATDRRRVTRQEPVPETGGTISTPTIGTGAVAKPARTPEVEKAPARGTREKNSGRGAVERRSRPTEKVSQPARDSGTSRRGSSNGNSSSGHGYSGSSGSTSSSGSSSSTRGSSSGSSSSGSSRRSKS